MKTSESLENFLQEIGNKLYSERHNRREKITCVASSIGVSHPVISQIENGRYKSLSFDLLFRLTNYYKIPLQELLSCTMVNTSGVKPNMDKQES